MWTRPSDVFGMRVLLIRHWIMRGTRQRTRHLRNGPVDSGVRGVTHSHRCSLSTNPARLRGLVRHSLVGRRSACFLLFSGRIRSHWFETDGTPHYDRDPHQSSRYLSSFSFETHRNYRRHLSFESRPLRHLNASKYLLLRGVFVPDRYCRKAQQSTVRP